MRLMTLRDMLDSLRHEARLSANPSHGGHLFDAHRNLLQRVQEEIYANHEWPALSASHTLKVPAGSRFLAYPEIFDYDGIRSVHVRHSDRWISLVYGIDASHLNDIDSDDDKRGDRIRRWKNFLPSGAEKMSGNMCELWPIPDTDCTLRFEGKRALFPLSELSDQSTVDGPLIVLHGAIELLGAQGAKDTGLKLQKAQARMDMLKQQQAGPDNRVLNMAAVSSPSRRSRGIEIS